jgi:hypothetical protein
MKKIALPWGGIKGLFCIGLFHITFSISVHAQIKPTVKSIDSAAKKKIADLKKSTVLPTDTTLKDQSLKSLGEKQLHDAKTKIKGQVAIFKDTTKRIESAQKFSADQLNKLAAKKNALRDSIKKGKAFRLNHFSAENATLVNGTNNGFKRENLINTISVYGQVQVFKFPLAIDLANNSSEFQGFESIKDALFKVNFDKSQVRELYQKDLDQYQKFRNTKLSGMNVSGYLKKQISGKLNVPGNLNNPEFKRLNTMLNNPEQLNALLRLNEDQIREKVNDLMTTQKQAGLGKVDSVSNAAKQEVQAKVDEGKAAVTREIVSMKHEMEDSGLDQQRLQLIQKFITSQGNTDDLQALFENEMNSSGESTAIGKFYGKVKEFQAGNFGRKMPGIMNRDLLIKGLNFTVKTGRGPVNLGFGLNQDVGMPKDGNFNSSLYDSPKFLTYMSVPTSNFSFGSGKLSWVGGFDKQKNTGLSQLNAVPKNGLAFMVSQDVNMNNLGKVTVELSKSSTQYKNVTMGETDKLVLNNDLKMGNYFRDDVLQTASIGIKHNIEIKKAGLSGNTFFSYSGIGFQNPGQQGYGNLGMRYGGSLKKNFLRNRIVLNVRTDLKNTPLSATSGAHWRNYNVQLDGRFKVSKSYTFNLKYADNGVNKVDGGSQAVYASKKMQVDMNTNYKIGSNYGLSRLSIGKQTMLNPTALSNTNFMTVVYTQNLMMKSVSFTGNAFYNKELSGLHILGDMLNADLGCQYTLLKNVSISSAITYLDNQNIARQVGMRQNLQLSVLKNFDVSAFVDLRKNLKNPLYPELFATGTGELSIRYFLK